MSQKKIFKSRKNLGFTLIELLVVISIIALLSSIVVAVLTKARRNARNSQRIQTARQIAIALEQYENSNNTYKISNAGDNNTGTGYVAKAGEGNYSNSILSVLKSSGFYTSNTLRDPVFGTDNYYLGVCTSTNAYNIFVKLEESDYSQSTSSIANTCGGKEAAAFGFSFIASTAGGSSGGGGVSGYSGASEVGVGPISFNGLTYNGIVAEDGRIWLDRNLGATQVAASYSDLAAHGYYYQWGRGTDGHQIGTSGVTSATSSLDNPPHSNFITNNIGFRDWRSPQNFSLWQGVNGVNNPCPPSLRLPTISEWQTWITARGGFTTATCGVSNTCREAAFNSILRLTSNGVRYRSDAVIYDRGLAGYYWSSTVGGNDNDSIGFDTNEVWPVTDGYHANGFAVRCIKN